VFPAQQLQCDTLFSTCTLYSRRLLWDHCYQEIPACLSACGRIGYYVDTFDVLTAHQKQTTVGGDSQLMRLNGKRFRPHRSNNWTRRIATDGVAWSVCMVVCLSAGHVREPWKNGWTDRDADWRVSSGGYMEPSIRWSHHFARDWAIFWVVRPTEKHWESLLRYEQKGHGNPILNNGVAFRQNSLTTCSNWYTNKRNYSLNQYALKREFKAMKMLLGFVFKHSIRINGICN